MNYVVTSEQAQAVLNYLVERPYREVHAIIPVLLELKPEAAPAQESELVALVKELQK